MKWSIFVSSKIEKLKKIKNKIKNKIKFKFNEFSENKNLNRCLILFKVILICFLLAPSVYLLIGPFLLSLNLEYSFFKDENLCSYVILTVIFLIFTVIATRSTLRNKNEYELISDLIDDIYLPFIALISTFIISKVDILAEVISAFKNSKELTEEMSETILLLVVIIIVPSILSIFYNIKVWWHKDQK